MTNNQIHKRVLATRKALERIDKIEKKDIMLKRDKINRTSRIFVNGLYGIILFFWAIVVELPIILTLLNYNYLNIIYGMVVLTVILDFILMYTKIKKFYKEDQIGWQVQINAYN